MENASKALLIAGAILIGILLLSLTIYIANSLQGMNTAYEEKMSTQEILKFNQQIIKNLGTDDNGNYTATAQQLVTIKHLEEELKTKTNKNIQIMPNFDIDDDATYLKENYDKTYIITMEYDNNGLINKIEFGQIRNIDMGKE